MRKILILLGSPRKNGNTAALAEAFSNGAKESGHEVTTYWLGDATINPCKACDYCQRNNGKCIQKDSMTELYKLLQNHDTIVIASPVYYLGFPGSIKNVIDRTYAESVRGRKIKYSILLTAACKEDSWVTNILTDYYKELTKYIGVENLGIVSGRGVEKPAEVKDTKWIEEAFQLGKRI
ncbi:MULTISPECIES: flavodoxin family protein [Clostridium]|uniref:Putative NAD(P)H-dependent FMN-containing oxidoreductase YwqN n=1 Tax=Clostridium ragsdalei P11 TaxID=1353534 RepID=A0A1A6AV16_9CLOT|nr:MULTISPECIES: flavodoxin family protein [Clostridium]OBR93931.1 putative NAD(P)H-dependent FMN-containing oxidoreductase YwqN [Clostridium ragsdalei P11]QXE17778.1 NADPH-dependent FMN reductase [Clostridium sp. 001]